MLLGHWIEMRSVMGASSALEKLAELLPSVAHRLKADGSTEDIPVEELQSGDRILIKPGEKIPADGIIVDGKTNEIGRASCREREYIRAVGGSTWVMEKREGDRQRVA